LWSDNSNLKQLGTIINASKLLSGVVGESLTLLQAPSLVKEDSREKA